MAQKTQNTENQRLKILRESLKMTQQEFADILNMSRSAFGMIESGKNGLSYDNFKIIISKWGINPNWLMFGNGSMNATKNDMSEADKTLVVQVDRDGHENIVMVPVKAQAGYLSGYSNVEFIKELQNFYIPGLGTGTYRCFEISGDSMYPDISNGDWVICSYVEELKYVRSGYVYVVISEHDGIVCKRLENRLEDLELFVFHSDNPIIGPFKVPPEDIREIWEVKKLITDSFNRFKSIEVVATNMFAPKNLKRK